MVSKFRSSPNPSAWGSLHPTLLQRQGEPDGKWPFSLASLPLEAGDEDNQIAATIY